MKLAEELLFRLSRWRLRKTSSADVTVQRARTSAAYAQWRDRELQQHLKEGFPYGTLAGKQVLDFGCGKGALAFYLSSQHGVAGVIGLDIAPEAIASARKRLESVKDIRVSFRLAEDPTKVDCDEASIDIICAFDSVEHVMVPEAIIRGWHRVLKPAGQVWIWWLPWRHPFGHHLSNLIPLPWVHLVFSEKTLIAVAARIYDDPCYVPRAWDLDATTGLKRPNRWRQGAGLSNWLNRLTLGRFRRLAREANFDVAVSAHGIGSGGRLRALRWVARLPLLGELVTSHYTAILTKRPD